MKKQKSHRTAPRRKPIKQPQPQRIAARKELTESEIADLMVAKQRAHIGQMPPEVAAEFNALCTVDHPEGSPEALRTTELEDIYPLTREILDAELAKIRVERDAKSRGSSVADLNAMSELVKSLIRETLNPEELAEFNAASEAANDRAENSPEAKKFTALLDKYLAQFDPRDLQATIHNEGLSFDQIMARYPKDARNAELA